MAENEIRQPINQVYRPRKEMLLNNFLGGVVWGMGTLIGAAILVTFFGLVFSNINLIPIIGTWVSEIIKEVNTRGTSVLLK